MLGDKSSVSTKITLVKNDKIISEDDEVANTFKDLFDTAVQSLNLTCDEALLCDTSHLSNPIDVAMEKLNHPSTRLFFYKQLHFVVSTGVAYFFAKL